jgi:hypothetical protein
VFAEDSSTQISFSNGAITHPVNCEGQERLHFFIKKIAFQLANNSCKTMVLFNEEEECDACIEMKLD